jgi:hypothetical protein
MSTAIARKQGAKHVNKAFKVAGRPLASLPKPQSATATSMPWQPFDTSPKAQSQSYNGRYTTTK